MTPKKLVGFTPILHVTDEQLSDLVERLRNGDLAKIMLTYDTAYFRRAHKSRDTIAETAAPFRPGETDRAERLVPRAASPIEASKAYQAAASLEPNYSDEETEEAASPASSKSFYLRLYSAAIALGAILAILCHA